VIEKILTHVERDISRLGAPPAARAPPDSSRSNPRHATEERRASASAAKTPCRCNLLDRQNPHPVARR
jgi:hypothetical protein